MRTPITTFVLPVALLAAAACSGTAPVPEDWNHPPAAQGATETHEDRAAPPRESGSPPSSDAKRVTLHPEGGAPVTIAALAAYAEQHPVDRGDPAWRTKVPPPPTLPFDAETTYEWLLETNRGDLRIRLLPDTAPKHVASTMWLTSLGFYDGLTFHRVIPGFMAQGGCPLGTGVGNPGFAMDGEYPPGGPKHDRRGIVSIANAGEGTDGSQFFITFAATSWLDGKHTIFGELIEGDDTLKTIEALGTRSGKTQEPIAIESATIVTR